MKGAIAVAEYFIKKGSEYFAARDIFDNKGVLLHISDTYGHCFRKHPDSDFGIIRTLISAHPDTLSKD
jgi:hypothetical protein